MKILRSFLLTMSLILAGTSAAFAISDNIPSGSGKSHSGRKHSTSGKHHSGSHKSRSNIPSN